MVKTLFVKILRLVPVATIFVVFTDAIYSILTVSVVKVQQRFFDSVELNLHSEFEMVVFWLVIFIFLNIVFHFFEALYSISSLYFEGKITEHIYNNLHEIVGKLNPILFESTEKLNEINKAEEGAKNAVVFIKNFLHMVIYYVGYFLLMSVYLYTIDPVLTVSIILLFVPVVLSQLIRVKVFDKIEDLSAPERRKLMYYEQCMTDREYYKETRITGSYHFFMKMYDCTLDTIKKIKYKACHRVGWVDIIFSTIKAFANIFLLVVLFNGLLKGRISVGVFAAIYSSINVLCEKMNEMVNSLVSDMSKSYASIKNYLQFIVKYEKETDIKNEYCDSLVDGEISLANVWYKYPMAKEYSIKDVSLNISKGQTIAIVGENGSGKTTLAKVIMGIYKPDKGMVKYDGITRDIEKYRYKGITSVFQKFQKYRMKLNENIIISDAGKIVDFEKIEISCANAGINIGNKLFDNSYDTILCREFGGVELSGGMWQRVAIARALYRNYDIIILDEPTSAIDPFEESRLYKEFKKASTGKISVIITHRIGAARIADIIIVMKKGMVVGIGNHTELLNGNKDYSELYYSQKNWYDAEA